MEEDDQPRNRSILDELTVDSIEGVDVQYLALREELESDARDFEAPTWSLSVDQQYVRNFSKDTIKRQDVIYELIQTEINHVRTLKLMLRVYLLELRNSLLLDESQLERLFPCVDRLLSEHQKFLQKLKNRRRKCLETGSEKNYCITNIGDILKAQFSDDSRIRLQDSYSIFCSRHSEAGNLYKEQMQNNKKFQSLIRRIGQSSIVRRLGIPEGILLITQRITKYPVLVERIIKNTEADTQEYADLVSALDCIKDTISTVDLEVHQYKQLREIAANLDAKSYGSLSNGKIFRRDDLLQKDRKLLREGVLTWRPQNRSKALDILMVLLPDLLLLLQEKDQKYVFASLDGKPAVLPLQKLIVREAAHSNRAMYLISASDVKADLYEFHTSTAEERSSWRQQIWETIERYPHAEEDLMVCEDIYPDKLQKVHDLLIEKDAQIEEFLRQKLQILYNVSEVHTENSAQTRLLLRGSATELLQGELLVNNAIIQAEHLQMQLMEGKADLLPPSGDSDDVELHRKHSILVYNRMKTSGDGFQSRDKRPNSDPHLKELNLPQPALSWLESADKLIRMLYSLKALIAQQDSELEVLRAAQLEREQPYRQRYSSIQDQERQRHLEKQREELLHLQKVHMEQKQEQAAWARERQRHLLAMHTHEQDLSRRMDECTNKEAWLNAERDVLSRSREDYQQDLERLRVSTRTVEKERDKLEQEKSRFRKHKNSANLGGASHLNNMHQPLSYSSPEDMPTIRSLAQPTVPQAHPPQVPPRKESMSVTASMKSDVPIQLLSTTNEVMKFSSIQQQIPTKLAISKGKEKNKSKQSHHRTNSAASIEVSEVLPIKVSGKEGGSLRAMKTTNQHTHTADIYPEHMLNSKPPQSANPPWKPGPLHNQQRRNSGSLENIYYC